MAVAVNGMHFTGMYALRISGPVARLTDGFLPATFIGPIVIFVVTCILLLMVALLRGTDDGSDPTLRLIPIGSRANALSRATR